MIKKWYYQTTAKRIVDVLNKKSYNAFYAENADEAKKILLDMIPEGAVIGSGGSVTIKNMGLFDEFRKDKYKFIDRYNCKDFIEEQDKYTQALMSDVFVTGTNAITKNGELVNVDSSGNRVAAMIWGPKSVIIVAGANKVVNNLDDAFARLKKIAPLNCKRLNHQTPCAVTGECENCQQPSRMCNYTTIIHHGMKKPGRINIIIVAEDLGF